MYVSERTSSRLIAYRVQDDGTLAYSGVTDTETQPRGFRIDATGRFLVACGEKSTHVSAYAIDADTGALTLLYPNSSQRHSESHRIARRSRRRP